MTTAPVPDGQPPPPTTPRLVPSGKPGWLRPGLTSALVAPVVLATAGALGWWWAGTAGSLASTLLQIQRWLPSDQVLEFREVRGSLREGGSLGGLRWSSTAWSVELHEMHLRWDLAALLQGHALVHEARIGKLQVAQHAPATPPSPRPEPWTSLVLPLQVTLPLTIGQIDWKGVAPWQAHDLAAHYRFDGTHHTLALHQVQLAQGSYTGQARLQGAAPMALQLQLRGDITSPIPASRTSVTLHAMATAAGSLSGKDAQVQVKADLRPVSQAAPATTTAQATLHSTVTPWATNAITQAQITARDIDLAAFWPGAPHTLLSGTAQVKTPSDTAWSVQADLNNAHPGPWDQGQLPLASLQGKVSQDAGRWTLLPTILVAGRQGRIELRGHYEPHTGHLDGQAAVDRLSPGELHTGLAAAPLQGRLSAQARTPGPTVQLQADLRSSAPAVGSRDKRPRIHLLQAQGQWKAQAHGGQLTLEQLRLEALGAETRTDGLQLAWSSPPVPTGARNTQIDVDGTLELRVPGAHARFEGRMANQQGAGHLNVELLSAAQLQDWWSQLRQGIPSLPSRLAGLQAQGQAQLSTQWRGGWQALQPLWITPTPSTTKPRDPEMATFQLQAQLNVPRMDLGNPESRHATDSVKGIRALQATLNGAISGVQSEVQLSLQGQAVQGQQQLALNTQVRANADSPALWRAQVPHLRLQWRDTARPGPWTLELTQGWQATVRNAPALELQAAATQARLTGPLPGAALLQSGPLRYTAGAPGTTRWQTQGQLDSLPLAWVDALVSRDGSGGQSTGLMDRLGAATDLLLRGQWRIDNDTTLRAQAHLERASGDIQLTRRDHAIQGPIGVQRAHLGLDLLDGNLRARLQWASTRAGEMDITAATRLGSTLKWASDAPLSGTVRARLPDIGVWSALAPPGWRIRGTLNADATLSGQRQAPHWTGTLSADELAVRSVVDGVDLSGGRLRATLHGDQLELTEFNLQGGRGSKARIPGLGGNRTDPPDNGGMLTANGHLAWGGPGGDASRPPRIEMQLNAQAQALQVLVRADRQVSVSGKLQATLLDGQIRVQGALTTDRATVLLPEDNTPTLGEDVVVHRPSKDRTPPPGNNPPPIAPQTAQPPDIAVRLNLGRDFAVQGQGITTRLQGEVNIRSSGIPGTPPRVTGEVRTEDGRYRAWGQALNVETGLIRFNGPYNNPALDILALRPQIAVRAGVQVTGSALAPRVRLYSDPELPDAEKLSWVVLGRDPTAGGAESAVLQQAALALLGNRSPLATTRIAERFGVDEIGFRGATPGQDASSAALTLGKRLSRDLYVTYERSLSGTLGTLYIFYDLSRRLTLRGQTGEKSAVDIVYTVKYD